MLRPDQQAVVRTSIATMETVWPKPATANNVAVPAPAFSKPEVTEQWLADLELADGEDEYPNELDASLIAFLDPSREKAANPSKPGLPSSMLNHLEELERSLARGIRKAKDPS